MVPGGSRGLGEPLGRPLRSPRGAGPDPDVPLRWAQPGTPLGGGGTLGGVSACAPQIRTGSWRDRVRVPAGACEPGTDDRKRPGRGAWCAARGPGVQGAPARGEWGGGGGAAGWGRCGAAPSGRAPCNLQTDLGSYWCRAPPPLPPTAPGARAGRGHGQGVREMVTPRCLWTPQGRARACPPRPATCPAVAVALPALFPRRAGLALRAAEGTWPWGCESSCSRSPGM